MKILILILFIGVTIVILFDEIRGTKTLSSTIQGKEGGLNLTPIYEHGTTLFILFLILIGIYIVSDKLAIMLGITILAGMIITGRY